jgi:hypothetical protein
MLQIVVSLTVVTYNRNSFILQATGTWELLFPTLRKKFYNIGPSCSTDFKVLNLTRLFDYSVTTDGRLVSLTGAFQSHFDIGDFCLDVAATDGGENATWQRVALTCDRCIGDDLACVRACCSNFNLAEVEPGGNDFSCVFRDELGPTLDHATWTPNLVGPQPDVALVYDGRFGSCDRNKTKSNPDWEILSPGSNSSYW